MGNPWVDGDFTFDLSDNLLFKKDANNYIDALGIQQLNTIGNIYFLDIFLSKDNCVEMHYHPNASELTYCIAGSVEVAFINPNNNEWQSFKLEKGDAVSIPQGFWHVACALTDDVHLLATHDTNNLQTVFGSDLLRITPAEYFADIYCLSEQEIRDALAPIDHTVIIGPPSDCERGEEVQGVDVSETAPMPPLKKARRPKIYEQAPEENGEIAEQSTALMNENHLSETRESVPYGGTLLRPIHLCENCLKQY